MIYKKMNNEINGKLLDFLETMNERAEKFPISMEEITKEVEEVRGSNYGKIDQHYMGLPSQHKILSMKNSVLGAFGRRLFILWGTTLLGPSAYFGQRDP